MFLIRQRNSVSQKSRPRPFGSSTAMGQLKRNVLPLVEALEDRTLPSFNSPLAVPIVGGSSPRLIAVGDFNRDGIADLVVANANNTVSVLLGTGNGGFAAAAGFPISGISPVIGDFNRDGNLDLAVGTVPVFGNSSTNVYLGNGGGGFTLATGSPFSGGIPVAAGDFNGDFNTDLALVNANTNTVQVLLGNGSGGFTAGGNAAFPSGFSMLVVGDFNGDGKADLAVGATNSSTVSVLLGNSNGGFTPGPNSPFPGGGSGAVALAVGDINGDGKLDLAVVAANSNTVSALLGDGGGGFAATAGSPYLTGGSGSVSVAVGDFNRDGKLDLAVANANTSSVSVLLADGRGGFTQDSGSPLPAGGIPSTIFSGDFNGDGKTDLVTANPSNTLSVFLNSTLTSVVVPVYSNPDLYGPHPNSDARTAFVHGLYRAVLDRDGDPTGVAFWVNQLNLGMTPQDVALRFVQSPEHRDLELNVYYSSFLGRSPDPAGKNFWINQMLLGMDETQVIASFLTSPEYTATHASAAAFVQGLYNQLLQRTPDAGGAAAWAQAVSSGLSRSEVVLDFLFSAEGTSKEVAAYYLAYLHRQPDPSAQSWADALQTRSKLSYDQVVAALLGSLEFSNNAQAATP